MNKQDIIDYVMETPENINPVILGQFLDEMGGENEREGEVWLTYHPSEPTGLFNVGIENNEFIIEEPENYTIIKSPEEWADLVIQGDNIYRIKIKGYFSDFPNIEANFFYRGTSKNNYGLTWSLDRYDDYNDYFIEYSGGIAEDDIYGSLAYLKEEDDNIQYYPTKIEIIVYKK